MNRAERIYRIHALIKQKPRPLAKLMEELEASRATVVRDLNYLRDFMGAPIKWSRADNAYGYEPQAPAFELPGMWLNESELFALLASERLLEQIQPKILSPYIGPLRARIRKLLAHSGHSAARINQRIRLQPATARGAHPERFGNIAAALLQGRQLHIRYHGRERDRESRRTVHPQRLLHYRDNWYLAAYCEQAESLRLFALERIREARPLAEPANEVDLKALNRQLGASFGIFSGSARDWAVLRFSPQAARWVADEDWHPDQIGHWDGEHYELQIPYSDPRELLMDILKYGPEVEVVGPEGLREMVVDRLQATMARYSRRDF